MATVLCEDQDQTALSSVYPSGKVAPPTRMIPCQLCDKAFLSQVSLAEHILWHIRKTPTNVANALAKAWFKEAYLK